MRFTLFVNRSKKYIKRPQKKFEIRDEAIDEKEYNRKNIYDAHVNLIKLKIKNRTLTMVAQILSLEAIRSEIDRFFLVQDHILK